MGTKGTVVKAKNSFFFNMKKSVDDVLAARYSKKNELRCTVHYYFCSIYEVNIMFGAPEHLTLWVSNTFLQQE
jgi:hypothetical protein